MRLWCYGIPVGQGEVRALGSGSGERLLSNRVSGRILHRISCHTLANSRVRADGHGNIQ
jgi:hypothetical protein